MGLLEWTFVLSLFLPPLAVIAGAISLVAARWIQSVRRAEPIRTPQAATR
jgi:hypothetical protein